MSAQSGETNRAIDLMLLIDNSCSMFPANRLLPSCDSYGSDPDYLRITGVDLFAARLGFGAENEAEYQVGVIGFGAKTTEIIPLQPLMGIRDEIAKKIADPNPESATQIVPALEFAYQQFADSPNRRKNNLPAMVVITDGVPWPAEGQSQTDIEKLIDAHSDIPLFMMLLQNPQSPTSDYAEYIDFWKKLQARNNNLFVYSIQSANQIEETYNTIIAQLQNTVPSSGSSLKAGKKFTFFVSDYVQKVIITVIRKSGQSGVETSIMDPKENQVKTDEEGVNVFHGEQNPVDVISITAPRLAEDLKGQNWTLMTDSDVTVLVDREGSYQISFIDPAAAPTDVLNVSQVVERLNPTLGVNIRFSLVDDEMRVITDPQVIRAEIIDPTGKQSPLSGATNLLPGPDGVYNLRFDPTQIYPDIADLPGRFVVILKAGLSDLENPNSAPIASSRLILNMGRIPYIRSIAPSPLICEPNWKTNIRVGVGDYDAIQAESELRVQVVSGDHVIELDKRDEGAYSGDITAICQTLLTEATCTASQTVEISVQMLGQGLDNLSLPDISKDAKVQINPAVCTPTPIPSATPIVSSVPTAVPDSDHDGVDNPVDQCPNIPGLGAPTGCPKAWKVILIFLGIALLIAIRWVFWPRFKVRSVVQPPHAFLLILHDGKPLSEPVDLFTLGQNKHISNLKVGSNALRCDIVVEGLRGVEFIIGKYKFNDAVRAVREREPFLFVEEEPRSFRTSDPRVVMVISRNRQSLVGDE
ncbi:MAG: vWA domain-containing protein [Anaerolineaceae bacterium]